MSIYFVSGVPGAGKTTLCKEVTKQRSNLNYLNIGKELSNYIEKEGDDDGFDDMLTTYLEDLETDILLDTHAVERTKYGLKHHAFKGLSDLDVCCYIFVDADEELIYERRDNDTKERQYETPSEIKEHQNYLHQVVISRATRDEVPSYKINNESSIEDGVEFLEEIIEELE